MGTRITRSAPMSQPRGPSRSAADDGNHLDFVGFELANITGLVRSDDSLAVIRGTLDASVLLPLHAQELLEADVTVRELRVGRDDELDDSRAALIAALAGSGSGSADLGSGSATGSATGSAADAGDAGSGAGSGSGSGSAKRGLGALTRLLSAGALTRHCRDDAGR